MHPPELFGDALQPVQHALEAVELDLALQLLQTLLQLGLIGAVHRLTLVLRKTRQPGGSPSGSGLETVVFTRSLPIYWLQYKKHNQTGILSVMIQKLGPIDIPMCLKVYPHVFKSIFLKYWVAHKKSDKKKLPNSHDYTFDAIFHQQGKISKI